MLVGYPPFFSDDPSITCQKILHWRKTLVIPEEANLSPAAIDIIKRLVTDANERLGVNGVEEIKAHPFFAGIDWKTIRDKPAVYIPQIKSEIDVSNFDQYEQEESWLWEQNQNQAQPAKKNRVQDTNFIGYTFKREDQRVAMQNAFENLEQTKMQQQKIINKFKNLTEEDNQALNKSSNCCKTEYIESLPEKSSKSANKKIFNLNPAKEDSKPQETKLLPQNLFLNQI